MQLARRQMRTAAYPIIGFSVLHLIFRLLNESSIGEYVISAVFIITSFVFAYGILKGSRSAALSLFILTCAIFSISLYKEFSSTTNYFVPLLLFALIFLLLFLQGVRGTFRYYHLVRKNSAKFKASSYLFYGYGICVILPLVLLGCTFAFYDFMGYMQKKRVISGHELSEKNYKWLVDENIIKDGEQVEFFFSDGIFTIHDDGNIQTSNRLIAYRRFEDNLIINQTTIDEVMVYGFSAYSPYDSCLFITTTRKIGDEDDEEYYNLELDYGVDYECVTIKLSPLEGGDIKFMEALIEKFKAKGWLPTQEVLSGKDIPKEYIDWMREKEIIDEFEDVLYFYSNGLRSIHERGYLLTDKQVLSYLKWRGWKEGDELEYIIDYIPYNEVVNVEINNEGGEFTDARVHIYAVEYYGLDLLLSTQNNGDEAFINEIIQRAKIQRQHLMDRKRED